LARYTHRVAISNQRLIDMDGEHISFHYKDYADYSPTKTMRLKGVEFLRRFLMHVLPRGFVRIRHYGWLANRKRGENLARCRRLLGVAEPQCGAAIDVVARPVEENHDAGLPCPVCKTGTLLRIELLPRMPVTFVPAPHFIQARALTTTAAPPTTRGDGPAHQRDTS
jgi:hypothetical protein